MDERGDVKFTSSYLEDPLRGASYDDTIPPAFLAFSPAGTIESVSRVICCGGGDGGCFSKYILHFLHYFFTTYLLPSSLPPSTPSAVGRAGLRQLRRVRRLFGGGGGRGEG